MELVSSNLSLLLRKQLEMKTASCLELVLPDKGAQTSVVSITATMQYMESLIENFPLGEAGLKLQLPLGTYICCLSERALFWHYCPLSLL